MSNIQPNAELIEKIELREKILQYSIMIRLDLEAKLDLETIAVPNKGSFSGMSWD